RSRQHGVRRPPDSGPPRPAEKPNGVPVLRAHRPYNNGMSSRRHRQPVGLDACPQWVRSAFWLAVTTLLLAVAGRVALPVLVAVAHATPVVHAALHPSAPATAPVPTPTPPSNGLLTLIVGAAGAAVRVAWRLLTAVAKVAGAGSLLVALAQRYRPRPTRAGASPPPPPLKRRRQRNRRRGLR